MRNLINTVAENLFEAAVDKEEWILERIHGKDIYVGWTRNKDSLNRTKHGLSLRDGIPLLSDDRTLNTAHFENSEERDKLIGVLPDGRCLVAVVSWIDTGEEEWSIRMISVRLAEASEKERFVANSIKEEIQPTPPPKIKDPENTIIAPGTPMMKFKDRFKERISKPRVSK